ncbi:MAG: DUF4347 domain-containing protein [Nitrospira sp.]|nr:DUF4347 domain-containing protein [Nitrospira sp.]
MFNFLKKKKDPASATQNPQHHSSPSSGVKRSLLSLEPRLMFDAAAAATASEVASEQVAQEQAEAAVSSEHQTDGLSTEQTESEGFLDAISTYNPGESRSEVVFVDPTVPNYQDLLSGMDSNIEVIMLDGGQDGIEQMVNALSGRTGIDAIHLISHGEAGELQLGTGVLNADSMSTQYADDLAVIQQSLSEQADILVYGCEFAQGEAGQAAVDMLAELTGADVQASNDLTGSISLGGDWEFEVNTGTIETSLVVDYDAQMNWLEVLGKETVADTFSEKSYGNNDGTGSWSSNWSEADVGKSDANGGHIKVNSGELRIETQVAGASVSRGVDLSGARNATLSFDYNNDLDKGGSVEVRISTDGGANYRSLSDGTFSKTNHIGSGTASFDISDHMSANTKIQFMVTGTSGGDRLFIDNIQVDYTVADANTAPTELTLTDSTVAENSVIGTNGGTTAVTDSVEGDPAPASVTTPEGELSSTSPGTNVSEATTDLVSPTNTVTEQTTTGMEEEPLAETEPDVGELSGTGSGTNVNQAMTGTNATYAPTDDAANILTTANFGIQESSKTSTTPSSGPRSWNELEEDGFRLPDTLRKAIEMNTEDPLPIEIIPPEQIHFSVGVEQPIENVVASRETEQLFNPGEKRGSDRQLDSITVQDVADAGRKDFLEPDDPIESGDEANAMGLSATIGLAGVVLQNSMGNKSKLSTLISRPASAPNVPPNPTPPRSSGDDHAPSHNKLEHP